MPAYPCEKCGAPVELSELDGRCKKCGETRPFKCSKCGTRMSALAVYKIEKIHFKKPLYCQSCGPDVEQVECRQCGLSLMRCNGVTLEIEGKKLTYHRDCYEHQLRIYKRILPIAMLAMFIICGYLAYMCYNHWSVALCGGIVGIWIGSLIAKPFALKR